MSNDDPQETSKTGPQTELLATNTPIVDNPQSRSRKRQTPQTRKETSGTKETPSTPTEPNEPQTLQATPEPDNQEGSVTRKGPGNRTHIRTGNKVGRSPNGYKRQMQSPDAKIGFRRTLRIANLSMKGMPNSEIAEVMQISINTINLITTKFSKLIKDLTNVPDYRALRVDILDGSHMKLLESVLDDNIIAEANLRDRAWAAESIYKQSRLERGLSTSNQSTRIFSRIDRKDLE